MLEGHAAETKLEMSLEEKSHTQVDEEDEGEEEEDYDDYGIWDIRAAVLEILEEAETPGSSFAVGGTCAAKMTMPGLVIDGVGDSSVCRCRRLWLKLFQVAVFEHRLVVDPRHSSIQTCATPSSLHPIHSRFKTQSGPNT